MRVPLRAVIFVLALTPSAPTQSPAGGSLSAPIPPTAEEWLVPIHSAPADPVGGAYGTWTAGPDYKASFHDGFAFYPVLGQAWPENLPLVWRTETIAAGGQDLVTRATPVERHATDWRYELRYGAVTEAYDVLREGVEQSFVLHRPPARAGDIVVTGCIETDLVADATEARHGSLTFRGPEGTPLVVYGAAVAFDAAGRRTEVTTRYADGRIRLRLDGGWLAAADYPVTIDPLTARTPVQVSNAHGFLGFYDPPTCDMERDDESNQLLVAFQRWVSYSDADLYVRLRQDDFTYISTVYTDVTSSWVTGTPQVAFVGGADRWVVAFDRRFLNPDQAKVRAYVHARANTTLNSGTTVFLNSPSGTHDHRPSVGGTAGYSLGTEAAIVFQRDEDPTFANTANSEVLAMILDASTASFGPLFALNSVPSGQIWDREDPQVNRVSDGGSTYSWLATWREYDHRNSEKWYLLCCRVRSNGTFRGHHPVGPPSNTSSHKFQARIEGRSGRYLLSHMRSFRTGSQCPGSGNEVMTQRIDWPETSNSPTTHPPKTILNLYPFTYVTNGLRMGYDSVTWSHWTLGILNRGTSSNPTSRVSLFRLGFTGGVVETIDIPRPWGEYFYKPSVTFDDDSGTFPVVWPSLDATVNPEQHYVYGARLEYEPTATNTPYGNGCLGSISARHPPYAGSEFFTLYLDNGAALASTLLGVGFAAGTSPLGGGCELKLDLYQPTFTLFFGVSDSNGAASHNFPLSDDPLLVMNLYFQWFQLSGGSVVSTQGLRSRIR